ncbi:gamma-glutamyltransferase [Lichenicola cladoniae]|uniref:gamma-glutamyltransferase n=1 Tax=Lichenicola cladoniae TaxID=1484109 RepID=UPI001EF62A3D|nr:gamma-glutamyltransferase [Lichenicola cladoniae]
MIFCSAFGSLGLRWARYQRWILPTCSNGHASSVRGRHLAWGEVSSRAEHDAGPWRDGDPPHHAASHAGLDVLREGVSPVQDAVETAAVLAVVYPHRNSIGGDGFWLIRELGEAPVAIAACGRAAAAASYSRMHAQPQLIVPCALDTNDMRLTALQGFNSGDRFFSYRRDALEVLYVEGEINLRCFRSGSIVGQPRVPRD